MSNKDWIFFIDSDEILQPKSLDNLRENILKVEKASNDPVVFSPKVLNVNDTIVYNAGRVIKNDDRFKFYGAVHEYPIYMDDLNGNNYITLRLSNVVLLHDGYKDEVFLSKHKALRNSTLDKKMLEEFPNSDRYYYFYYRDAKSLISDADYEMGLKDFEKKYSNSSFLTQVYSELISHLISSSKTKEAEDYLEKYYKVKDIMSDIDIIRLSALNEIQKISKTQQELLRILSNLKDDLLDDEYRLFENGYMIDDIIGYLYWCLGEFDIAKEMYSTLKANNYFGMLDKLFKLQI